MSARTRASSPGGVTHYARIIWDLLETGDSALQARGPDRLMLVPIVIPVAMTIDRLGCIIHANAGNIRMGIYRDNGDIPDGGALLAEGGPQVALGNQKNEVAIAATVLAPGLYWLALLNDDGACAFYGTSTQSGLGGTYQSIMANAVFGPLPDPCPATWVEQWIPNQYVRVASVP